MKERLVHLERLLRHMLEGSLERLLGMALTPGELAGELAQAMLAGLRQQSDGTLSAPDRYALTLHADERAELLSRVPELPVLLGNAVLQAARNSGYTLFDTPRVDLTVEPQAARGAGRVRAWHSAASLGETRSLVRAASPEAGGAGYLVADDGRTIALKGGIFRIGRLPDNDLVLDDPRVSRRHAQVEIEAGRFMLTDAKSKAGTRVNGKRVKGAHVLAPGDVIEIAGHRVLFRFGERAADSLTQPIPGHP